LKTNKWIIVYTTNLKIQIFYSTLPVNEPRPRQSFAAIYDFPHIDDFSAKNDMIMFQPNTPSLVSQISQPFFPLQTELTNKKLSTIS